MSMHLPHSVRSKTHAYAAARWHSRLVHDIAVAVGNGEQAP